jgi:hypothetical protein
MVILNTEILCKKSLTSSIKNLLDKGIQHYIYNKRYFTDKTKLKKRIAE